MNAGRALRRITAAFLAAAAACVPAYALGLSEADSALLKSYETSLAAADPAAAAAFLGDAGFAERLKEADPRKAADLTAKARGLKDLKDLLSKPWRDDQELELSQALALRVDLDTPLSLVGVGPEPEKVPAWMARYGGYTDGRTAQVKGAIRQYETVKSVFEYGEAPSEQVWARYTLRERNGLLAAKASGKLERMINNETRTGKEFQEQVRADELFRYLDPAGRARYQRYLTQLSVAETAKAGLSPGQLEGIKDQPIEQQMYLLGAMFDGSESRPRDPAERRTERRVDGARQSMPGETLSYENNRILTEMLRNALPGELKGTAAGNRVLAFYKGGKPQLAIESCRGCYAKYEPSTGRIVLDSDMIQQYLRVNDIRTEDLLQSKEKVDALAEYISPIVVHEASHQMQHARSAGAGTYDPYVQEDEIESNSFEASYTAEKLKKDAHFRRLFAGMRGVSTYADQRLKLAQRFNRNPDDFGELVRRQYYYGLPSYDAASSQVLAAVSGELERRKTLDAAELDEIESGSVPLQDAMGMTAAEVTGSVTRLSGEALAKIQSDLMSGAGGEGEAVGYEELLKEGRSAPVRSRVPAL